MEFTTNEQTGNQEFSFSAKLVSIADKAKVSDKTGKSFRNCTVQLPNGNAIQGMMNEKNYAHGVSVNSSLLCRAIKLEDDSDDLLIVVSHLVAGNRATVSILADAFGDTVATVVAETKTETADLPA